MFRFESALLKGKEYPEGEVLKCRDYKKEVIESLEKLKSNFDVRTVGHVGYGEKQYSLFLIAPRSVRLELPNVFISAGVHGYEPAGVYALLDFFKTHSAHYRDKVNFFAVPCVNPSGFENDMRTTQNGVDVNRDFIDESSSSEAIIVKKLLGEINCPYIFTLDMHEDRSDDIDPADSPDQVPQEAYVYESSVDKESSVGASVIRSLEKEGIKFSKTSDIYGDHNDGGVIWAQWGEEVEGEENNTLQGYLERYTRHTFTTETPTKLPMQERKRIQIQILRSMLDRFCDRNSGV